MPEFYTWTILLINQLAEIGEKQLSVFWLQRGAKFAPLMHVALCFSKNNQQHTDMVDGSESCLQNAIPV